MRDELILVVDDIDLNREILESILSERYDVVHAANGVEAVRAVMEAEREPNLILLDIMMPEMDGHQVLEVLGGAGYLSRIPVVVITASGNDENELRCLRMGAVDFVYKPFNPEVVLSRVNAQIEQQSRRAKLEETVSENLRDLSRVREGLVELLCGAIEERSCENSGHIRRIGTLAERLLYYLGRSRGPDGEYLPLGTVDVARAAALHDVGKIVVPEHILLKPGPLTEEEFEVVKRHPAAGAKLVDAMHSYYDPAFLRCTRDICLYHHECWDGAGYPEGLRGADIPFAARVMAICDFYDVFVSERVYKPAYPHEEAIRRIAEGAGTRFDPVMAALFVENAESFRPKPEAREDAPNSGVPV